MDETSVKIKLLVAES